MIRATVQHRVRHGRPVGRQAVRASAVGAIVFASFAAPLAAVEVISIPVEQITIGAAGESILVASVTAPEEFIGRSCEITGTTDNQASVHVGNDLLIVTGDQTIAIANFEDEQFIAHGDRKVEAISATIDVFVRLGPDGISSGGFRVDVSCPEESPPTTTTAPPPTTAPPTTAPPTTVPVEPSLPPTSALAPPSAEPTTTVPPPSPPGDDPPGLPVTGGSGALVGLFGLFIACAGVALTDVARTSNISRS